MITQKYLKECVHYDPLTGVFTWLERPESHFKSQQLARRVNSRCAGNVAGSESRNKTNSLVYWKLHITGDFKSIVHSGHRMAWLYMHGCFPEGEIDHIDGDGANNMSANLRDVTRVENGRNQKRHKSNTSGVTGVTWVESKSKWKAQIGVNNRIIYLGNFDGIDAAVQARRNAEIKHGFHANHGR